MSAIAGLYLVPLPMISEVFASRTIQLRQAHILPSGWNQVSMDTKSPLHAAVFRSNFKNIITLIKGGQKEDRIRDLNGLLRDDISKGAYVPPLDTDEDSDFIVQVSKEP